MVDDDKILEDYRVELYIEEKKEASDEGETNVVEVLFFKRVLGGRSSEDIDALVTCKVRVDYNIDDSGRFIGFAMCILPST